MFAPSFHLAMKKVYLRSQLKCHFLRKAFNESYNLIKILILMTLLFFQSLMDGWVKGMGKE